MNINFSQFLLQCAAMGVWVFICAGLYAVWEIVAEKLFPGFLDVEAEGASQAPSPMPVQTDAAEKKA